MGCRYQAGVKEFAFTPARIKMIWKRMLEAVDFIHSQRVIHSDLKPANFLFVKGELKLIDFGIARSMNSDTTNIQVQPPHPHFPSPACAASP
jgi:serine/threonine protein kinase